MAIKIGFKDRRAVMSFKTVPGEWSGSERLDSPRHDLDDWILRIRINIDARWEISPIEALDERMPVRQ
jgi:hypothetical protein